MATAPGRPTSPAARLHGKLEHALGVAVAHAVVTSCGRVLDADPGFMALVDRISAPFALSDTDLPALAPDLLLVLQVIPTRGVTTLLHDVVHRGHTAVLHVWLSRRADELVQLTVHASSV